MTVVLCYDVERAKTRRRVSGFLEDHLVRVQKSVFEGRLTAAQANRLFDGTCRHLDVGDSLRMYVMTRSGLEKSRVWGGAPLPEEGEFYLL
ncbi:hypothetical protein MYXO_02787 [Myxococcaceae bacterium]|nr:hypothetical protein MYXO_02787 [Myxococcaceae bacterium]